jgi:uncharacterized membrane protein YdjX (TVP38/TMEM64 family)
MFIDPVVIQWACIVGASFCAYMAGKLIGEGRRDDIIENTIQYLIDNNLVRHKLDKDGEIELLPLDDK